MPHVWFSVYYMFMVDLKVVMVSMPLPVLWHAVRVCWFMVGDLSRAPCMVTITESSVWLWPVYPNQQPQLCDETYETLYLQGGAHFHLIGSSCFSLVPSEKYWKKLIIIWGFCNYMARCHGLVVQVRLLPHILKNIESYYFTKHATGLVWHLFWKTLSRINSP